jgi:hypothetical protein
MFAANAPLNKLQPDYEKIHPYLHFSGLGCDSYLLR